MNFIYLKWRETEVETLIYAFVNGTPVSQLSTELGRTKRSIYGKANSLGLTHKTVGEKSYTLEEDQFVQKNAFSMTCKAIGKALGRSIGSVRQRGNRLRISFNNPIKKAKYIKNQVFFDNINKKNSYIAGLLAADGWIRPVSSNKTVNQVCISLAKKDIEIFRHFKNMVEYSRPIREYFVDGHPQAELRINGVPRWINSLSENWSIGPNKSLTIGKPSEKLNQQHIIAYLVGLIEGDGSIRISGVNVELN